jgi:hypothetical protein
MGQPTGQAFWPATMKIMESKFKRHKTSLKTS